jgi:hypothetical protein
MQAQMLQTMQQTMANMQQAQGASASATTLASRQAWRVSEDQAPNILTLHRTNGRR